MPNPDRRKLLPTPTRGEDTFVGSLLRTETVGGAIVLAAAVVALIWANSPWSHSYDELIRVRAKRSASCQEDGVEISWRHNEPTWHEMKRDDTQRTGRSWPLQPGLLCPRASM